MIVTIASGKGGTGKTTLAAGLTEILAPRLGAGLSVIDLDVEAPNLALFLNPEMETAEDVYLSVPKVDESKCNLCRACAEVCQYQAIAVLGEVIYTASEMCHGCGGCKLVCPEEAITWDQRLLGQIRSGRIGPARFIEGRLRVGEAMAPPLMRRVKAGFKAGQVVLVDAPPGTSCPAVTAVRGSDVAVMVTEPTPFGLNDLELALRAFEPLKVSIGVVINRSPAREDDSSMVRTRNLCRRFGAPVWLTIPDDSHIARSYARGLTLTASWPGAKEGLDELWGCVAAAAGRQSEASGGSQ